MTRSPLTQANLFARLWMSTTSYFAVNAKPLLGQGRACGVVPITEVN